MQEAHEPLKVGFGPKTTMNSFRQSGELVAERLQHDKGFVCGFFGRDPFDLEELSRFDVLVFIKYYPPLEMLRALKSRGKKTLLDMHDRALPPSTYETNVLRRWLKKIYYARTEARMREQLRLFDLCFTASPVALDALKRIGANAILLPRQIYNHQNEFEAKVHSDKTNGLVIYWTGVGVNQRQNDPILPALKRLHEHFGCRIIYSSDTDPRSDLIEYHRWQRDEWEKELLDVDIAFRWQDHAHDALSREQPFKDPNKLLSYMAAGLPTVVCPTGSERMIARDGETAAFANTSEEFEKKMEQLVTDPKLRKRIGEAAHKEVWAKYSLAQQVETIKDQLLALYK